MEAAMKMARQYYMELNPKQPQRTNFIAREGSFHGATLGSLSMSGHVGRRKLFEGMLFDNVHRVSAANEYRGKADGQTTEDYVQQLADELDRKFQEIGPDTVCAFVSEPVVGAVSIFIVRMFMFLADFVA
jgi:adenosylmethionine-8-amino-7-oxononanoate aminotransferase